MCNYVNFCTSKERKIAGKNVMNCKLPRTLLSSKSNQKFKIDFPTTDSPSKQKLKEKFKKNDALFPVGAF